MKKLDLEGIINSSKFNLRRWFKRGLIYSTALLALNGTLNFSCSNKKDITRTEEEKIEVIEGGDIKLGSTNASGEIAFIDNSDNEEVIVNVVNPSGNPLSDIDVTYFDGEGYEVFMLKDPDKTYLPKIEFYQHNSFQTITMSLAGTKGYGVETETNSNKITVAEKFSNAQIIEDGTGDKCDLSNYLGTMTGEDYYNYLKIKEGIYMLFLGQLGLGNQLKILSSVNDISTSIADVLGIQTPEQYIKSHHWDLYALTQFNNLITSTIHLDMVSNPPTITVDDPVIDGDDVVFSWQGTDPTMYQGSIYLEDATVCLEGNIAPDLYYELRLFSPGSFNRWLYLTETSKTIYDLDDGEYSFEVAVFDEVGNGEISDQIPFVISTGQTLDSLIIQPGSDEGKDAYVKIMHYDNQAFYNDDNFDERRVIVGYEDDASGAYKFYRGYIKFLLTSVPSGKEIKEANLSLYYDEIGGFSDVNTNMHVIEQEWSETGVTWDNQPNFTQTPFKSFKSKLNWIKVDITSVVQDWYNGTNSNYGILLKLDDESNTGIDRFWGFYSSDYTQDSSKIPKLVIKYTD